ncbi:hypothetical protein CPB84DRAFT_1636078, partial [Gymnopilus junonius]
MYGVFATGLLLSSRSASRIPGILLSAGTAGLFFFWRRHLWNIFGNFYQAAMEQDLSDIGKHYGSEPSAFWVAEVATGSETGTVIGCVGLDASTTQDSTTVEIRRMVVSPKYQRHGVGSLLLTTAIEHARSHEL